MCILTENQVTRNEIWCAVVSYNNMCHVGTMWERLFRFDILLSRPNAIFS